MKQQSPTSPRHFRRPVAGDVVLCPLCPDSQGVRRNRLRDHGRVVHGLVDKRESARQKARRARRTTKGAAAA